VTRNPLKTPSLLRPQRTLLKSRKFSGNFLLIFIHPTTLNGRWVVHGWLPDLGIGYIPPFPDLPMTAVSILVVDLALIPRISDSPASRVH